MASPTRASFGGTNSGVQAGVINGNFTAHIQQSESSDQACLRDLRTTNPSHDKDRIQNTNGGLLKDSYCWILDNEEFKSWLKPEGNRLLWVKGDPGKGKTMLLCGVIDELTHIQSTEAPDNNTIAFFFCQATDERVNSATAVLRGLTYSLVETHPSLLSYVRKQYDKAGKALFEDRNAWNALSKIFKDILRDPTLQSIHLVIDALDECTTGLDALLDFLLSLTELTYSHVKLIVSSRNWLEIEERLNATSNEISSISLENNRGPVSAAVNKFVLNKVDHLTKIKRYSDETRNTICRYLSLNSQDTFLWVALVCQSLEKTSKRHALQKLKAFPPGLDALYYRMMDQIDDSEDASICFQILAVVAIVYQPIFVDELASLIDVPDVPEPELAEILPEIIATCGSFLTLREGAVVFIHQSAKDFILGDARDKVFVQGKEAGHYAVFSRSLQTMSKFLQRNIPDHLNLGTSIKDAKLPESVLLASLEYACVHWVDHLQDSWNDSRALDMGSHVEHFLRHKFLNWLEALSLLDSMPQGIKAMLKLETLLQGQPQPLLDRVRDASRFIRYHGLAIEIAPLQAYNSALVFSPRQSITKISYQNERPSWILNEPVTEEYWSSCLQTLEGHSWQIDSVSWSPDRTRLASGASDRSLKIWDPDTGLCELNLEVNCFGAFSARSLAWSADGTRLASGLSTGRILIWDLTAGQCEIILDGHKSSVGSLLWLQDGRLISGSVDCTIKVWNTTIGYCVSTLKGHTGSVNSIVWLQDKSQLASGSADHTIRVWDLVTGQSESTLEAHSKPVSSISWIDDRNQLVSGSVDGTIKIWDLDSGQCRSTLVGHVGPVNSVAWASDKKQLASGGNDGTIRLWNLVTGQCESTLEGHGDAISSIDWAHDGSRLASGSDDLTIRIWSPSSGHSKPLRESHVDRVMSINWSPDGLKLASTSIDQTIKIWDPVTGNCESDLKLGGDNRDRIKSISWSNDGIRLASIIYDTSLARIWNTTTGECELALERHAGDIGRPIVWSPDGTRIAFVAGMSTVKIWDLGIGQRKPSLTLKAHFDAISSIVWSPDGSRLVSSSDDDFTVNIWNTVTGQCISTFPRHYCSRWSIAPFGNRLAFLYDYRTIEIWDMITGKSEFTLEGHQEAIKSLVWSQDGSRLASSSEDGYIKIWDLNSGLCQSSHEVGCTATVVEFDELDPNQLHTSIGALNLDSVDSVDPRSLTWTSSTASSSSGPQEQGTQGYNLSRDMSWITYKRSKHLWLPTEYRPHTYRSDRPIFNFYKSTLAIGSASGRVIFLELKEEGPGIQGA